MKIPEPPNKGRNNNGGRPRKPEVIEAARWVVDGGWRISDAASHHGVSKNAVGMLSRAVRSGKIEAPWR